MADEMRNDRQEEFETRETTVETDGAENENTNSAADSNEFEEPANSKKTERTFTQTQVNRMMAREKTQGKNSVYNELGLKPGDAKTLRMVKAFLESQKTDEEKDMEQRNAAQSELAAVTKRAVIAEAKAEAMMAGIKSQYVEDAVTLALAKSEASEDAAELTTIFSEFKTKYPVWFGGNEDSENKENKNKTVGQRGTGASVKATSETGKSKEKGLGARLAAQRKNQLGTGKKSFWN